MAITKHQEGVLNKSYKDIRELEEKMLYIIKLNYENKLKNIDSVISILKALLQISGSLFIASISIPQLKIDYIITIIITTILIVLTAIVLYYRTKTTRKYFKEYLDACSKQTVSSMNIILDRLNQAGNVKYGHYVLKDNKYIIDQRN